MYALQNQNVERKIAKNIGIQKDNDTPRQNTSSTSINDIPTVEEKEGLEFSTTTSASSATASSALEANFVSNASIEIPDILRPQPQDDTGMLIGSEI
jgi:hypothetical protein